MGDDTGDRRHDWDVVVRTVEQMVTNGTAPSSVEFRELLLPVVERLPDVDLPDGFRRVLREIDAFLASRPSPADADTGVEASSPVKAVADLVRDRTVVLIGGVRLPHAHEAMRRAFALRQVDWVETRPHESITTFEPHIARSDVALVLLAIRWSSHAFGEVQAYCDKYGKPLVRLPAGYNPKQVAAQILTPCGERLAAAVVG